MNTTRPTRQRPGLYSLLGHTIEQNEGHAGWLDLGEWSVVDHRDRAPEPWLGGFATLREAVEAVQEEVG